jgi:hypothetical protein
MPAGQPAAPAEKQAAAKKAADGVPADLTNLALGAGLLLSAFLVFWMGLYLANHVALRALVASFGTFALVWVLHRLRIFHRPHGGLIAAGSVALFAAALPFIERGFLTLDRAAKAKLAGEPGKPDSEPTATLPVPTRQQPAEIPPPPTPAPPEDDIVRELIAPAPDPSVGKIIRVTQDAKIELSGRKFLIKAGSQFPFKGIEDGIVTFLANGQEVTIQSEIVTFMGKSKETPEEITKLAGTELMRRYPAIRSEGSPENKLYVARVNALRDEMPELFKDPQWPIIIGEQLAAHEGWTRADAPPDNTATPDESPKAPQPPDLGVPPPPPIPSDIPQEAPK